MRHKYPLLKSKHGFITTQKHTQFARRATPLRPRYKSGLPRLLVELIAMKYTGTALDHIPQIIFRVHATPLPATATGRVMVYNIDRRLRSNRIVGKVRT